MAATGIVCVDSHKIYRTDTVHQYGEVNDCVPNFYDAKACALMPHTDLRPPLDVDKPDAHDDFA